LFIFRTIFYQVLERLKQNEEALLSINQFLEKVDEILSFLYLRVTNQPLTDLSPPSLAPIPTNDKPTTSTSQPHHSNQLNNGQSNNIVENQQLIEENETAKKSRKKRRTNSSLNSPEFKQTQQKN
jgi:hypothetical protein